MADDADPIVTRAELARRLGLSTRTIGDHAAHGRLVRQGKGYALFASIRALVAYQSEALAGRNTEVQQARGRLELAKARLAELRLAEEEGRLVDALEMQNLVAGMIVRVRNRILAAPKRVHFRLPHLTRSDIGAFDTELREALTELANTPDDEET